MVVIGAGFGGLGAALSLAERGARVCVLEALNYPGGCAATFTRDGYAFEAGATVMAGVGPGQLFRRWVEEHGLDVTFEPLEPRAELRWSGGELVVPADRDRFVDDLAARSASPDAVRRWFALQAAVGDALWPLLADPSLLPPLGPRALAAHAARVRAYLPALPLLGRTAADVLAGLGVAAGEPLALWVDAGCRISVQCGADEAEAVWALTALDWWWRGVGHVRGGVGVLAQGLVTAIRASGGEVHLADRVRSVAADRDGWRVTSRSGVRRARQIFANLVPHELAAVLGDAAPASLSPLRSAIEQGWGAAMLYGVARDAPDRPGDAVHLQLVDDVAGPLVEGNHVFLSVSARADGHAPAGLRAFTASTHVDLGALAALDDAGRAERVAAIQDRMRRVLAARAPEWSELVHELPASPRTFSRFVRRGPGWVGGVPKRAGLGAYRGLWPRPVAPGLWVVGDTVFPGQSALAAAIGGVRTARAAVPRLRG